jgi:hypothetical protein
MERVGFEGDDENSNCVLVGERNDGEKCSIRFRHEYSKRLLSSQCRHTRKVPANVVPSCCTVRRRQHLPTRPGPTHRGLKVIGKTGDRLRQHCISLGWASRFQQRIGPPPVARHVIGKVGRDFGPAAGHLPPIAALGGDCRVLLPQRKVTWLVSHGV